MKFRNAFTMIELIFVIVVLGILAGVALPKFAKTGEQARLAKAIGDISSIRTGVLNERTKRLLRGSSSYMTALSQVGGASNKGDSLFDGNGTSTLFTYALTSGTTAGSWRKTANLNYSFNVDGTTSVAFVYNPATGVFTCNRALAGDAGTYCSRMID